MMTLLTMVTMTGCADLIDLPEGDSVDIAVELPAELAVEADISKIVLKISALDISSPISQTLTPPLASPPTFNVNVPIGPERLFEVTTAFSGDPKRGLVGKATSDVTEAGGVVPISLEFMNFAEDATGPGDAAMPGPLNPDIVTVDIFRGDCAPAGPPDAVMIEVALLPGFNPMERFRAIIEFDGDQSTATGMSPTFIEQMGPPVMVNFPGGSESRIEITVDAAPFFTIFAQDWIDHVAMAVIVPTPESSYDPATSTLLTCVDAPTFINLDPDNNGSGVFNVLVGTVPAALTIANDIAYRQAGILYDLAFDTSGL